MGMHKRLMFAETAADARDMALWHHDHTTDLVEVIAEAKGGAARTLVRILAEGTTAHVNPTLVRDIAPTHSIMAGDTVLDSYPSWKVAACFLDSFRITHPTARIVPVAL